MPSPTGRRSAQSADSGDNRGMPKLTSLLLNVGHALDHLFLLIFATAVGAIAVDFGVGRWEDMMPYTVGALSSLASGPSPQAVWAICGAGVA